MHRQCVVAGWLAGWLAGSLAAGMGLGCGVAGVQAGCTFNGAHLRQYQARKTNAQWLPAARRTSYSKSVGRLAHAGDMLLHCMPCLTLSDCPMPTASLMAAQLYVMLCVL